METQLVNLGRGTAEKVSCGVSPNKFVVRPLQTLSPVVGALTKPLLSGGVNITALDRCS